MHKISIIMYHYVRNIRNSLYPNIKGLEFEKFKKQLDYIQKNYNVIDPYDLFKRKAIKEKSCLLTFDDGYKDHIKYVFPELKKRGLKGCFFPAGKPLIEKEPLEINLIHYLLAKINNIKVLKKNTIQLLKKNKISNQQIKSLIKKYEKKGRFDNKETIFVKRILQHAVPIELRKKILINLFKKNFSFSLRKFANDLYMNLKDIKKLINNGMLVGSHTYNHEWLGHLKESDQVKEINKSIKLLNKLKINKKHWIMCFPYGSFNKITLKILRKKKFKFGFTTVPKIANLKYNKLILSRFDTNDIPIKKY